MKYLSTPFLEEGDPYNPKCNSLIRSTPDESVIHLPESFFAELNEPSKNVQVSQSRSIFAHTKRLRSTYLPKSKDPKDDLIIESTFTGTIVSFMLLTLSFMVYRRGKRFKEMKEELENQKTMRG